MSYDTDQIAKIVKVIDDDTGMHSVGDIEGAFDENKLADYLKRYGNEGKNKLVSRLAFMQWQVWEAWRNRNQEVYGEFHASSRP